VIEGLPEGLTERAIEAAREKLIHHWDRVAEAVMNGNTTREPAIDQFWQSLPLWSA